MHFAVDAHAIGRRLTGNEVYVRNLLDGFAAIDPSSRFTAYYCAEEACSRLPARFDRVRVAANPFVRLGAELSWLLRRDRPDLVHVQYTAPLACPVPVVVSVHDVSYLEHPEYFTAARAFQLRLTVERTVRRAVKVITPSDFSRRAIENAYDLDDEKVAVVPIAVSSHFRPVHPQQASARVRERFGVHGPFVLCVGDLQPRKNQIGLIEAFRDLLHAVPHLPHSLVLCGKDTWYGDRVRDAAEHSGCRERIHFTGFVNDDELVDLYNAADLFVFPSFYEGFGLPILEAMASGCAVACSNTAAMPEVANATALMFDPHRRDQIVRAMKDLLLDAELRSRMERLGLQRAAHFTWHNTARKTLDIYYQVAGQARGDLASKVLSVGRS
jgi:glycosyltransferase involved in cell wall biosynthesis